MTYPGSGQYNFLSSAFLKLCFHSSRVGLISDNLLFSLMFQRCCLCCSMYLFIFILKSVCGILNFFSVVWFRVELAALCAWSFPMMPVWLGTQHICISLSFDKFFNLQSILIINGWSNFLFFSDSNTDSESENMMNLLFLDSVMRSRAILIAQASALNIEIQFDRCFFFFKWVLVRLKLKRFMKYSFTNYIYIYMICKRIFHKSLIYIYIYIYIS